MPSRAWPIWLYTILLIVGYPVLNGFYTPLVSHSGLPPLDGEIESSFQSISDALVAGSAAIGALWFCTRRYNPETRLLAWSDERLLRSIIASLLFGAMFLFLLAVLAVQLTAEWRWYNLVWVIYTILWLPWPVCLRAALIDQRGEILARPKFTAAFALLIAVISYAGVDAMINAIGSRLLLLLGYREAADMPEVEWVALTQLTLFAACTYYAVRSVERPRLGKLLLVAPVPLLLWANAYFTD